jgi:N-acetylglucosamine-6-phosphate deacetylase
VRLRAERIVGPDGIRAGEVVVEDGRIVSVGPNRRERDELIDIGERLLVPGYIDMHVHGGGGAQCNTTDPDEIAQVAAFHAAHGTTGLVATTVPAPVDDLCASLQAIARCRAPSLLGAHLEGPFLNRQRPGALDPALFLDPGDEPLERLLAAAAGLLRVMTIAPELPGALALIQRLAAAGVVASIGHSEASDRQVRDAADAGATAATHVFNGMTPFHHRHPGVVGAVADLQQVSCELICDGVHIDPVALRMFYRAKGASGVRLVTDAIAAAGMPDGEYPLGARTVMVTEGRPVITGTQPIAGSVLTMEAAVQNAVRFLGIPIEEAVRIASTNSARLLRLADRKGAIAPGLDADLLVLDEHLAVEATMVAGTWLTDPP